MDDVLISLNKESERKYKDDVVISLLHELYDCMEKEKLLEGKINSKLKIQILKTLYKFVESQEERILIIIAKIILAVSVNLN